MAGSEAGLWVCRAWSARRRSAVSTMARAHPRSPHASACCLCRVVAAWDCCLTDARVDSTCLAASVRCSHGLQQRDVLHSLLRSRVVCVYRCCSFRVVYMCRCCGLALKVQFAAMTRARYVIKLDSDAHAGSSTSLLRKMPRRRLQSTLTRISGSTSEVCVASHATQAPWFLPEDAL